MRSKNESAAADERVVLSVEEVGEMLRISRRHAYQAFRDGWIMINGRRVQLPSIRIGRRIMIPKAAFERLLDVPPAAA